MKAQPNRNVCEKRTKIENGNKRKEEKKMRGEKKKKRRKLSVIKISASGIRLSNKNSRLAPPSFVFFYVPRSVGLLPTFPPRIPSLL